MLHSAATSSFNQIKKPKMKLYACILHYLSHLTRKITGQHHDVTKLDQALGFLYLIKQMSFNF